MSLSERRVLTEESRSILENKIKNRSVDRVARDLKIIKSMLESIRLDGVVSVSAANKIALLLDIPSERLYTIQKVEVLNRRISKQVGIEIPAEVLLDIQLRVTRIALHLGMSLPRLFMSQRGLNQVIDHKTYREILKVGKSKKETLTKLKDRIEYLEKFLDLPPIGKEKPLT